MNIQGSIPLKEPVKSVRKQDFTMFIWEMFLCMEIPFVLNVESC